MSKQIYTEIEIAAPSHIVWQVLIDFEQYPNWNPFIKEITGKAALNEELAVSLEPNENKKMNFKPVITQFKENRQLCWLGKVLLPGIFDGAHCFKIKQESQDKTLFIHSEQFSGILVPIFWGSMHDNIEAGFVSMNSALKKRCESFVQ